MKLIPEILVQQMPSPLTHINYKEVMGTKWWKAKRESSAARTGNRCIACGVHKAKARWKKWLEGHERIEINYDTLSVELEVIPLCHMCHRFCHPRMTCKMIGMEILRKVSVESIFRHGFDVLSASGLNPTAIQAYAYLGLLGYNSQDATEIVNNRIPVISSRAYGNEEWSLVIDGTVIEDKLEPLEYYENTNEWKDN